MRKLLLIVSILSPFFSYAQELWTPDEIINTQYVASPVYSPDESMILWSKRIGLKKEDKFVSKLFLTHLTELHNGKPITVQLTQGTSSERNAFFSKDGKTIYFLSSKDKGKKLWKMSVFGGEAQEVHEFTNGISSVKRFGKNKIAFISTEGKSLYDLNNEKVKDNTNIVEDSLHWNPTRVYAFDLKSKEIKRLSTETKEVDTYDISENGKYLITRRTMSLHNHTDGQPKPVITLYNLNEGTSKQILKNVHAAGGFTFTPDETGFYYRSTQTSSPKWDGAGADFLYYYDIASNTSTQVPLQHQWGLDGGISVAGNTVLVELANGPYRATGLYQKNGSSWKKVSINYPTSTQHTRPLTLSESGSKLMYIHSTAAQLPRYYSAKLSKEGTISDALEWISLNDNLKKKTKARAEVIYWKGADDVEINGVLYYPKNYEKGKKYPLILSIHGGPTGVDKDQWSERWSTYPQIYTDKGAFVLKPNYQGSGSHGQAFAEKIKDGEYYNKNQIDLFNGIQHLNQQGFINMDKLGIMGWSNGAILTTWMTLQYPDMFQVAAPGAGDVNWTSDYGTCRFGVTFDQYYLGGAPWDDTNGQVFNENYIKYSPLFEIEKIKTPTIIFHGSEDRAVPRDQGWEYFRGLQQVGIAPVKFLWFPGQPHGLQKITHQTRKMKEEIAWIDQFLFEKVEDTNEAFKKDTPLDYALKKAKLSKVDGLYGVNENNILVPETLKISKDSTSISIFEITNAQYASYDKNYKYLGIEGNHPVMGLSQNQVIRYIEWLNESTGKHFRLPNEKEGKALHKLAVKNPKVGNTFNAIVGYDITLEDANKLKPKVSQASLVSAVDVGSSIKVGEAQVYNISGNVAEYFTKDGKLEVYGYDANTFIDILDTTANTSKHIGFRLILEHK